MLARVHPPVLAPQPFAVEEMRARELSTDSSGRKVLDRLDEKLTPE